VKPRDAFAQIAQEKPVRLATPHNVETSERDDVKTLERENAFTSQRDDASTPAAESTPPAMVTKPDTPAAPARRRGPTRQSTSARADASKRPHTSLYLSNAAMRALRIMAAEEGVSQQDLIREGLAMVFRKRHKDFAALDAEE
jgi:hypothetical protein